MAASPSRILIVSLRHIGDFLLTTPVIRSVRRAWPESEHRRAGVRQHRGHSRRQPRHRPRPRHTAAPDGTQRLRLLARLWRFTMLRYPRKAETVRRFLLSSPAGCRVGVTTDTDPWLARALKRLHCIGPFPRRRSFIASSKIFGLPMPSTFRAFPSWFVPQQRKRRPLRSTAHTPSSTPRRCSAIRNGRGMVGARWGLVLRSAVSLSLRSAALAKAERRYLDGVWRGVTNSIGWGWPETVELLSGARVYVGPDASITHLAAAAGCPTVALFGPMDPRVWGPWPVGGYAHRGSRAARSSIVVMSGSCRIRCRVFPAPSRAASARRLPAALSRPDSSPSR